MHELLWDRVEIAFVKKLGLFHSVKQKMPVLRVLE